MQVGFVVVVSASHTVLDPKDGVWKHAKDAAGAVELQRREPVLWNIITERHKLAVVATSTANPASEHPGQGAVLIAADFQEIDDDEELLARNLRSLNEL